MTRPGLETVDWESLDFLGRRDGKAPLRAYLVTERGADLVGVELRAPSKPPSAARPGAVQRMPEHACSRSTCRRGTATPRSGVAGLRERLDQFLGQVLER